MPTNTATIRRQLDSRFAQLPKVAAFTRPPVGWIRAIRQALGMSAIDLASRMGLTKTRVLAIEQSEAMGALKLDTLNRAAEALDCTLVYALIPKKPLDEMVSAQAIQVAREHVSAVGHTMRLEDQGVSQETAQQQFHDLADDLVRRSPRSLWKRRSTG